MATKNSKQVGHVSVLETENGTFVQPSASDVDVLIWGEGQSTVELGNESLGSLADGGMDEAPVAGGQRTLTLPDFAFFLQHGTADDGTDVPKNYKYILAGGAHLVTDTTADFYFGKTQSCYTLSSEVKNLACNGDSTVRTGRGMKGNVTIGFEGANAPIIVKCSGFKGAFVDEVATTGDTTYSLVGEDVTPRELASRYTAQIDGVVYAVQMMEFTPAIEVTMDIANNESGIATGKATGMQKRLKLSVTQLTSGDIVRPNSLDNKVFDFNLVGGANAGFDVSFTGCELLDPSDGDIEGTSSWDLEMTVKTAYFAQKVIV